MHRDIRDILLISYKTRMDVGGKMERRFRLWKGQTIKSGASVGDRRLWFSPTSADERQVKFLPHRQK